MGQFLLIHRTKVAVAVVLLFALVAGLCSMLDYISTAIILTICAGGITVLGLMGSYQGYYNRVLEKNWMSVPLVDWIAAAHYARSKMAENGYNYPADFILQAKDCVEYTYAMMHYMYEWFYLNYTKEQLKGYNIPMGPIGFRHRRGIGHLLIEAGVDAKRSIFIQIWPGEELVYKMTKGEIATQRWKNFPWSHK